MNENNDFLVSTEWLGKSLDNPNICIVDCDIYDSFVRAHIFGAVGIKVHHYIKHPEYAKYPKEYPWVADPDVVKEIFEDIGIGDDTTVAYGKDIDYSLIEITSVDEGSLAKIGDKIIIAKELVEEVILKNQDSVLYELYQKEHHQFQTFKSKREIQEILDLNGITHEKEIVTY